MNARALVVVGVCVLSLASAPACASASDDVASATGQSLAADSTIGTVVYVRFRPHGAAFDYFMPGDHVSLHGNDQSGYACIEGTTRYGLKHVGWVDASAISHKGARHTDSPCEDYASGGHARPAYPCHHVAAGVVFRHGPSSAGDVIETFATQTTVGVTTEPNSLEPRPHAGEYVWVSAGGCNADNADVAPGKVGWVYAGAIDAPDAPPEPPPSSGSDTSSGSTTGGNSDPAPTSDPTPPPPHKVCCAKCVNRTDPYHVDATIIGGCPQAAHDFCSVNKRGGVGAWYEGYCADPP